MTLANTAKLTDRQHDILESTRRPYCTCAAQECLDGWKIPCAEKFNGNFTAHIIYSDICVGRTTY